MTKKKMATNPMMPTKMKIPNAADDDDAGAGAGAGEVMGAGEGVGAGAGVGVTADLLDVRTSWARSRMASTPAP